MNEVERKKSTQCFGAVLLLVCASRVFMMHGQNRAQKMKEEGRASIGILQKSNSFCTLFLLSTIHTREACVSGLNRDQKVILEESKNVSAATSHAWSLLLLSLFFCCYSSNLLFYTL